MLPGIIILFIDRSEIYIFFIHQKSILLQDAFLQYEEINKACFRLFEHFAAVENHG